MIVYRDIISEDEVLSDAFKLSPVVDKDGAVVSPGHYVWGDAFGRLP